MAKGCTLKDLLSDEKEGLDLSGVSFEEGIRLLEELTEKVEAGSLPLDRAIVAYERGSALVAHLRALVSGAEEKLRILQKGSEEECD